MAEIDVTERRRRAAEAAAQLPRDADAVGLGTGRTAALVVEALAARAKREHLHFACVSTSVVTEQLAKKLGLEVYAADEVRALDIAIDGADEVDPSKDLVKGLGGALVRERLVERLAARLVIVVDDEKLVDVLGRGKIPVEVVPFGSVVTASRLEKLGAKAELRMAADGQPFTSDNGNRIYDLTLDPARRASLKTAQGRRGFADLIKAMPGVVDHGLFLGMATDVIIGNADGTIRRQGQTQIV